MATIYELTGEYLNYQMMLESADWEDADLILEEMEKLNDELDRKADGYARIIRNMEANINAYRTEERRMADRRKTAENIVSRMKADLQNAMTVTGKKTIDTGLFRLAVTKNGGALPVIIDDEEWIPAEMWNVTRVPNKQKIADYINETGDISFAHFGERSESLRIK